ncbi:MAG TPA: Ig-like domain-containing protein, partial [Acidimicrobiales bacterium]
VSLPADDDFGLGINVSLTNPPNPALYPGDGTAAATFAQFLANTVSHEVAHIFGLNEAYGPASTGAGTTGTAKLDANGNAFPYDIMRLGRNQDPDLAFAAENLELLQLAMGLQANDDWPAALGLTLFRDNFNLQHPHDNANGLRPAVTAGGGAAASAPERSAFPLEGGPVNDALGDGGFDIPDPDAAGAGWQLSGGARIEDGRLSLAEDARLQARALQSFLVPTGAVALAFDILDASFDAPGGAPSDAFEVALLDAQSFERLAGDIGLTQTDAALNIQADGRIYKSSALHLRGAGATFPEHMTGPITVTLDLAGIEAGDAVALCFDLLGFGALGSQISIDNVRFLDTLDVNEPPLAADDAYSVRANQVLTIDAPGLLANDTDADNDTLTLAFLTGAAHGTVVAFDDGSFTYTPDVGFIGTDTFTYAATDGVVNSNVATVTVSVLDQAPVAADDAYSVRANQTLTVTTPGLLANDSDADNDALTLAFLTTPAHGTVVAFDDGSFTYTPNMGFIGIDTFTYAATDGVVNSNVATVTVSVLDQAPVAADDAYSVRANQVLTIAAPGLLANDTDADNDILTLAFLTTAAHGTVVAFDDGSFTYTPDTGFIGTDSFTYATTDGVVNSNVATVTISVQDEAPVAADDSYSVRANQALSVAGPGLLANDTDADNDTLTLAFLTTAAHGTVVAFDDGSFTYTPDT